MKSSNKSVWAGKKPSWDNAPKWANWLVQDEEGEFLWFEDEPFPYEQGRWEFFGKETRFEHAGAGEPNPGWEYAIECRENACNDNIGNGVETEEQSRGERSDTVGETTPEEDEAFEELEKKLNKNVKASDILEAGLRHMKDRAVTYDSPEGERSMAATVEAFNAITRDGNMNSEERGWLFMVILKAVRSQQGGFKLDNYEDGAAYFGLMAEAANKERG